MNFALLGDDPAALPLAEAIVRHPAHALVATAQAPQCHSELRPLCPALKACRDWEDLLADRSVDAVIVAGAADETLHAAKQLAASGRPLLVLPTPSQSSTLAYELALQQAETPVQLFPAFVLRFHPVLQKLEDLVRNQRLGKVRHLQLERHPFAFVTVAESALLSRELLTGAFLEDIDLLRWVGGQYDQVTATRLGTAEQGFSLASVTLAGSMAPQAVWSMSSGRSPHVWSFTVAAERGTARVTGDPESFDLTLTLEPQTGPEPPDVEEVDVWRNVIDRFAAQAAGEASSPDWNDDVRAFELADAVERSLRRRRTIDIQFEAPSERSVFKTQMTAAGCSLLVLTLLAVVLYLTVAAAFNLPEGVKQAARAAIFLPLGIFLALQLLYFVTREGRKSESRGRKEDQ